MDQTEYEKLKRTTDYLKSLPGYLQRMNLFLLCKTGILKGTETFESIARILAEYGVPVDDVFCCIVDILMALAKEEVEKGQHSA